MQVFTEHFDVTVFIACLVIGYLIKHAKPLNMIPNDYIPTILAVVGAIAMCCSTGFSVDSVIYGAFLGLASTGLHQSLTRLIDHLGSDSYNTKE